jgi:hypothetical protein
MSDLKRCGTLTGVGVETPRPLAERISAIIDEIQALQREAAQQADLAAYASPRRRMMGRAADRLAAAVDDARAAASAAGVAPPWMPPASAYEEVAQ